VLPRRPSSAVLLCLLLALPAFAGCGGESESPEVPHREGLFVDIGGLDYIVYITRELNLRDVEDKAYYQGQEAPPGSALYGVFLKACNEGKQAKGSASDFTIRDTQGDEYKPIDVPEDNVFAYQPGQVPSKQCIPRNGSAAATGPTAGALLIFQLPNEATENRPLELDIKAPLDAVSGKQPEGSIELDI